MIRCLLLASPDLRPRELPRRQRAAYYRIIVGEPERKVARRFRVHIRTIRRWVADVLTRDDTISQMLRAAAEKGQGDP